jgi:phosphoglycolate phosphatase-like HAD superfamily hydrolase
MKTLAIDWMDESEKWMKRFEAEREKAWGAETKLRRALEEVERARLYERDYYACAAMEALLARGVKDTPEELATASFVYADAMLAARCKRP